MFNKNESSETDMPFINRYKGVVCEKCLRPTRRSSFRLHTKGVQLKHFIVLNVPNFSTTSQADLNYHIKKKHSASQSKVTHDCQECG